jgi:hypothetical protein
VRADNLETLYRMALSKPAVDGIMMWGFWAGSHWRGSNAAIVNLDWTLNASVQRYQSLLAEWTTLADDERHRRCQSARADADLQPAGSTRWRNDDERWRVHLAADQRPVNGNVGPDCFVLVSGNLATWPSLLANASPMPPFGFTNSTTILTNAFIA